MPETKIMGSQPGVAKPIVGFAVVLAVALAAGAWLYLDAATKELERKSREAEARRAETERLAAEAEAPGEAATAPAMRTYAGELGGHRFQIDLPEGRRLSIQEGAMGDFGAYVLPVSAVENESSAPDMVISLVSLKIEAYAVMLGNEEPGTRLVPTADGEFAFWIRGWEDRVWPEFDPVAASFKAL